MISVGFGLKCPNGHMRVQVASSVGGGPPRCRQCGELLVADLDAAPVGANRECSACGFKVGLLSHDTGVCPKCRTPW
jgi:hypothetical protein